MKGVIIDYKSGNTGSLFNALSFLGVKCKLSCQKKDIQNCDFIILPGVGSFGPAVNILKKKKIYHLITKQVKIFKKPVLGICLGMQMFFTTSEEITQTKGFNFIKGNIVKNKNISHASNKDTINIGWSKIKQIKKNKIFKNIKSEDFFYFVHSYQLNYQLKNKSILAVTQKKKIPAVVRKGNIVGLQFHPEKSGKPGLQILKNFLQIVKNT